MGSLVVGFSFMVGSAASKYFEGVLFILFRRKYCRSTVQCLHVRSLTLWMYAHPILQCIHIGPYDVGDRISVSNVEHDTSPDGSTTWFVENLGLYSTVG